MSDSGEPAPQGPIAPTEKSGLVAGIMTELTSPINVLLIVVCGVLVYRILKIKRDEWDSEKAAKDASAAAARPLPKMKRRDFTFDELKEFDGVKNSDGRILIAVNGKVLDVTRGKKLYGPGAPYACYAGRDASRGLATFSLGNSREGYDDLSDLKPSEMESLREWEAQLSEKYDCVGKFLRPGEKATEYFDEEDSRSESPTKTDGNLPEADRET